MQFPEQSRQPRARQRAICLLIGALGASFGPDAVAQQLQLEEMVVTAQKREQSLQDVPIAVSALSGDALADAGIQNMSDITRQVPVLEVQSSVTPVFTNFRIRRVGNLGNIPTFEPAVGLFVDGAFRSRAVFGASELFDIERIEILRGPQSTLYGKNTTAGVIGIYTRAPSDELTGGAELSLGNIEGGAGDAFSTNFKGGVSGPFSDTVRGSLSASYADHDETMGEALANTGDDANDLERYSVRGQLGWDATEALNLRLIAGTVQEDDKQQTSDITYDPNGPIARVVLPTWRRFGISDTCASNDPHDRETCVNQPLTTDFDGNEVTLLGAYSLANGWTVNSISSWDHFRFEGTMDDVAQMMAPLLKFHDTQENESWQQELRLSSAGGETVDWLTGLFYYTNEFERGDGGDRATWLGDTYSAHPAVAAINQAYPPHAVPAADRGAGADRLPRFLARHRLPWRLRPGDVEHQRCLCGHRRVALAAGGQGSRHPPVGEQRPRPASSRWCWRRRTVSTLDDLERDTDEVTWSVTPQWNVTEDAMLFVTAAHGFKSGGFNIGFGRLPIACREFEDEDIMHYEAGVKLEALEGRARLAASTFYTEYEEYQDAAFVGAQFTVGNAEKAELKGAELEGTLLLTDTLTTDFSISYADFTYDENTHGQCYPGRAPDSPTSPGACDLSGEHPVNAPEWKTHLGLQYEQPVSWGEVYARADWSWTDEYNTSFSADPRLTQDAYSWLSLRAGTRWDAYDLVLWVENATDETVVNFDSVVTLYAASTDGSYQSLLQAPRSYGVTFRVNY